MNSDGPLASDAEELYYTAFRKSLVFHAERGRSNRLDSENVQLFTKAVRLEQNDQPSEARRIYGDLIATLDPDGKEQHVYRESEARLERLSDSEELPRRHDLLAELINKARNAQSPDQLVMAHDLLVRIQLEFAGEDGFQEIVHRASSELEIIKGKIVSENQVVEEQAEDSIESEQKPTYRKGEAKPDE